MKHPGGTSSNPAVTLGAANSRIRWDSPKLREIEQAWRDMPLPPNTSRREEATRGLLQMAGVLRARLTEEERRDLVESFDTLPARKPRGGNDFLGLLPEAMVIVFLRSKDRDGLVTLLSRRFPPRIGLYSDVESELVSDEYKMKDSILILGEAYSECKVPSTRATIAQTVRHAFTGLGVRGGDDDEFVKNAMRWYKKNKDDLVVNYGYASSVIEGYQDNVPLFERRRRAGGGNGGGGGWRPPSVKRMGNAGEGREKR